MKKTFTETLINLAEKDKDIFLLTGDLGFSVFEKFAEKFPDRFIDCGVAEQTMAGVAAGLALRGKKPYIYSIVPFVTMRCFEQIRNDICYQNLNVKIVGIGAGFSYGALGATHQATEDVSVFRSLPNITILSPADSVELKELMVQAHKKTGPTYIRLDKSENFLIDPKLKIKISKPNIVKKGGDAIVITTGACFGEALKAVEKLEKNGKKIDLISIHTLKPVNEKLIINEIKNKKHIFVIEEHKEVGGLTSLMSELMIKNNLGKIPFTSIALPIIYKTLVGKQNFLRQKNKLDEKSIYKKIISLIK